MEPSLPPRSKTLRELADYLAFLVLYAPDEFPAWRQLNLEKAFAQLEVDVQACATELGAGRYEQAKRLIPVSLEAYRAGDSVKGAHVLQELLNAL
jgi:hypothetical protein